jgi:hypothetical protein
MANETLIAKRMFHIHKDPMVFLKYCAFTYDATDKQARPKIPFPIELDYVRQLILEYQDNPRIVIEKSRQLFVSWTFASLFTWEILTKPNILGLVFAQDQSKAKEFGQRVQFIMDNIPDKWWPKSVRPAHIATQEHITVPSLNSQLLFLPSSPNKGHGYTPTFTFFDEYGMHPWADDSYRAIIGGAVKEHSRLYIVSTPPPIIGDDMVKFYQICDDTLDQAVA